VVPKKGLGLLMVLCFASFGVSQRDQVRNVDELPHGWDFPTSWHQYQKPPAKPAALQICLQLLIPKKPRFNHLKTMDVSILSFPFNFFFF